MRDQIILPKIILLFKSRQFFLCVTVTVGWLDNKVYFKLLKIFTLHSCNLLKNPLPLIGLYGRPILFHGIKLVIQMEIIVALISIFTGL